MNSKMFEDFTLAEPIRRAIRAEGYTCPTDIQCSSIPEILAGRDVMATAQTGTGKTAAFSLPMLELLQRRKGSGLRALVLTPTRELALQVEASLRAYARYLALRTSVVVGGVSMKSQLHALQQRPDIMVATPGRLLDLIRQNHVRLNQVEFLVLDEADRMLDMGFVNDVRAIVNRTSPARQTLLFSATLSAGIAELAAGMLQNPVTITTAPPASVAVKVEEKVLFVDQSNKAALLVNLLEDKGVRKALVFTRTKHRAERLMLHLSGNGIRTDAIHSNRSQNRRQRSLADFHNGRIRVLVATDVVARGIDVENISHVINYELPNDTESYVHRVGRTARAGAAGTALSFCDATEILALKGIEKLIRHELPSMDGHAFHSAAVASMHKEAPLSARPVQWRSFSPNNPRGRRWGRG